MAAIDPRRMTAKVEGDFVVFLIGMRINKPWKIHKWLPVFMAMPPMIKELEGRPESGFMGHIFGFKAIIQYWRSFEHLEAYARSHDHKHWPAWVDFNKRIGSSRDDVGIWHETYQVRAGELAVSGPWARDPGPGTRKKLAVASARPSFGAGVSPRTRAIIS